MREWREQLDELVRRGRSTHGDAVVREALEDAARTLETDSGAAPLRPEVAVLGLEACAVGWVGVLIRPSGQTSLHVGSALVAVVEQVREQDVLGAIGITGDSAEVDDWLGSRPSVAAVTIDAQAAFGRIAAEHPAAGADPRGLLAAVGVTVPSLYAGMGIDEAELLRACVAAWWVADRFR